MRSSDTINSEIPINRLNYQCPVTLNIFSEPYMVEPCQEFFERDVVVNTDGTFKLEQCPCCRAVITSAKPAPRKYIAVLEEILDRYPALYQECYFSIENLAEILMQDELRTSRGERLINILQHAENHLNDIAREGPYEGRSAITLLVSHPVGRQLVVNDKKIKDLISDESKQIIIEEYTLAEWLVIAKNEGLALQRSKELLRYVMNGSYDAAEKLLQSVNPMAIVLDRIPGKEENGRVWQKISPLEFAAWAGDLTREDSGKGMVNLLLKYIPDNYRQLALQQLIDVKEHGTEHGKFLGPYEKLIVEGYDVFRSHINTWNPYNFWSGCWNVEQRMNHWIKVIGRFQRELPVVGIQLICDPAQSFSPAPTFEHAPCRSLKLSDGTNLSVRPSAQLSISYALQKADGFGAIASPKNFAHVNDWDIPVQRDRAAYACFYEVQKRCLDEIIYFLNLKLTPDLPRPSRRWF